MSETTNELDPRAAARDLRRHLTESLHGVQELRKQVREEIGQIERDFSKSTRAAKTLRDEVRVEARLAAMDIRQRWERIAEQALEAERKARHELSAAATEALDEAALKMRDFLRTLHGGWPSDGEGK